jgi:type IV secretion system protein VirD4
MSLKLRYHSNLCKQTTVGGGRGIRFNLFPASFSPLDEKYDKVGETIKGTVQT